jgi:hypothetical protein
MPTSPSSAQLYPPQGFGPPKDRRGHAEGTLGLPAGTEVFSADNHISLADDIFYERFPEELRDKAPRGVVRGGGVPDRAQGKVVSAR